MVLEQTRATQRRNLSPPSLSHLFFSVPTIVPTLLIIFNIHPTPRTWDDIADGYDGRSK